MRTTYCIVFCRLSLSCVFLSPSFLHCITRVTSYENLYISKLYKHYFMPVHFIQSDSTSDCPDLLFFLGFAAGVGVEIDYWTLAVLCMSFFSALSLPSL